MTRINTIVIDATDAEDACAQVQAIWDTKKATTIPEGISPEEAARRQEDIDAGHGDPTAFEIRFSGYSFQRVVHNNATLARLMARARGQ